MKEGTIGLLYSILMCWIFFFNFMSMKCACIIKVVPKTPKNIMNWEIFLIHIFINLNLMRKIILKCFDA
jgi:hypothetical protein